MQFTIEKEIFLRSLARVQGIVEKRNTIPILANVLIEADGEAILLTATDLEVGMQSSYPAQVKTAGKITVSAKKLFEIIKELPDQPISFHAKDNCWIEIRCGKALFNIVGLSPEEFPFFPQPQDDIFLDVDSALLREMVEGTAFSMSSDESKYNLNGIYFKVMEAAGQQQLRLVATDGHRLAMVDKPLTAAPGTELEQGVIFPRKGILELKKLAEEGEGPLQLGFMDNNAVIRKNLTTVIMRLVDGEFPDYQRVIPAESQHQAEISRDTLLHVLRRMAILTSEKTRGVKVALRADQLTISSSNPDFGDAQEELAISYAGPELTVGFNARFLLDILQALDCETIALNIKDNLSPGVIRPEGDSGYLAMVMPMRL